MNIWEISALIFSICLGIFILYIYSKNKTKTTKIKPAEKRKFKEYGITNEIMERLINHELKRKPGISRETAIKWALNRLARDNR